MQVHLKTLAFVLLTVAGAGPALAATTIYSGSTCTSDGAVERPSSGALLNIDNGGSNSAAKFHCPILRQQLSFPYASTLTLKVHAIRNISGGSTGDAFNCAFRTVDINGNVIGTTSFFIPKANAGTETYHFNSGSIAIDGVLARSSSFRCNVPDRVGGDKAGILSYEVVE